MNQNAYNCYLNRYYFVEIVMLLRILESFNSKLL